MPYAPDICIQSPSESVLRQYPSKYNYVDDTPMDLLLVEDTFSDALLTRVSLDATHIPYKLFTLCNGGHVLPYLAKYRRNYPDLILLDLGLPGMDGFEILAALAENPPAIRSIPIIILTGIKDFEYIYKAYPLYIMAYIDKPCNAGELRDLLLHIRSDRNRQARIQ